MADTFPRMLHALLGCEWGWRIALTDDRDPCQARAVQRVMLHGHTEGDLLVQLCGPHRDRVFSLTEPSTPGADRG